MKDLAALKESSLQDDVILYRALALFAGLAAGAGAALALSRTLGWTQALPGPDAVGPAVLGLVSPHQALLALLLLAGAALGAGAAFWAWLWLTRLQSKLGVPATPALQRATLPFVFFLPLLTGLLQGRPEPLGPALAWLAAALGCLGLAFLERGDRRKVLVAHPTESAYTPTPLFTHGGVLALGLSVGWYLQSLPAAGALAAWGMWLPITTGLAVWFLAMGLAGVLGFLYTKHTFAQSYHAVALGCLPLALLPLYSASWVRYLGADGGGFSLGFLSWLLPVLAGLGGFTALVLALLDLTQRPVESQPAWEDLFRALMLIAAVPLLLLAAAYWPEGGPLGPGQLVGPLDAFREGEPLAASQALLQGRLPFKEILFRHGFLSDAVTALAAWGGFGQGAEALRLLTAWLTPLGVVAIYFLAVFSLPSLWALWFALALVTGGLGWVGGTRFLFPYIGFLFTLLYLQRGSWPFLLFSGLATVLALVSSYSAGLLALAGNLALLIGYLGFGPAEARKRWLGLSVYLGTVVAGLAPWWLYLGMSGSLGAYFQNFVWVLTRAQDPFRQALPGWGPNPGPGSLLAFVAPPLAVLLGAFTLAGAVPKARERGLPWNVLLLTVIVALLWWRFVQRGEWTFLQEAMPASAMLLAFFLYRQSTHAPRLRGAVFGVVLLSLFIPRSGALDLPRLAGAFGLKNRVPIADRVQARHPLLANCYLPAEQAQALDELAAYLEGQVGSADAFYDLSNQPLLYFLVPRRPVTRTLSAAALATEAQQRDAVQELRDGRVKAVVYPAASAAPLNGVPVEVAQATVSEFLLRTFTPIAVAGGCVVLGPRAEFPAPDPAAAAALSRPLDLGTAPLVWGAENRYDPNQGTRVGAFTAADGVRSTDPAGLTVTAVGTGLEVGEAPGPVTLRLAAPSAPSEPANALVLTLTVPPLLDGETATLSWGDTAGGRLVRFILRGDGVPHRYALRVGAWPSWTLAGPVTALRLTLPGGGWTWESSQLLALKDPSELTGASDVVLPAATPGPTVKPAAAGSATGAPKTGAPAGTPAQPAAALVSVPQVEPTVKPTAKPTVKPTVKPTAKPTVKSTAVPSAPEAAAPADAQTPSADPAAGSKDASRQEYIQSLETPEGAATGDKP